MKNKKDKFKKYFRRGKSANSGHPTYIYAKEGDSLKFIGITHTPVTKGITNIPLEKNPNPKDIKQSYIRPVPEKEEIKKFGKRLPNWSFSDNDKMKVKNIINKDKKKT